VQNILQFLEPLEHPMENLSNLRRKTWERKKYFCKMGQKKEDEAETFG
jgi:hypothetical protein